MLADYTSYFAFSRRRAGYSGVATFCKTSTATPVDAREGIAGAVEDYSDYGQAEIEAEFSPKELKELDAEGRAVVTWHETPDAGRLLAVINVYCPRADPERADRAEYKLKFYKLLEMRADALLKAGHRVVIVGDVNTSHREIDHCDPYEDFGKQPGRRWLDHFLNGDGAKRGQDDDEEDESLWRTSSKHLPGGLFVDAFRKFHPDRRDAFTCWNTKMNCRETNYGTRIDYVFVDVATATDADSLSNCDIHPDILDSDHCPVSASFNVNLAPSKKLPRHCSKNFPEFSGKQQKVSQFFVEKRTACPNPMASEPQPPLKKAKSAKQHTLLNFFEAKSKSESSNAAPSQQVASSLPKESDAFDDDIGEKIEKRVATATAWKALFKGPPATPNCKGHGEPAVLRTVKKKGANAGRQFWSCARGEGKAGDPNARCDYFKWTK